MDKGDNRLIGYEVNGSKQVYTLWSTGTHNVEFGALRAIMVFLYDQGDLWELGDSSFWIAGGLKTYTIQTLGKRYRTTLADNTCYHYTTELGVNFCLSNRPNGCE